MSRCLKGLAITVIITIIVITIFTVTVSTILTIITIIIIIIIITIITIIIIITITTIISWQRRCSTKAEYPEPAFHQLRTPPGSRNALTNGEAGARRSWIRAQSHAATMNRHSPTKGLDILILGISVRALHRCEYDFRNGKRSKPGLL